MKNKYRIIEFLTGFHKIHHLVYSYGYKVPFIKVGYFMHYGFIYFGKEKHFTKEGFLLKGYHNCTLTNVY